MEPATYTTAKDLAQILGITVRAVHMRAVRDGWEVRVLSQRGDKSYRIDGLPPEIRVKVIQARESAYQKGVVLPARSDLDLALARQLLEQFDAAPAWSRRKAEARGEIVEAFGRFAMGRGLTEAKAHFIRRYNAGNDALEISTETYDLYKTISRPSLDLWRARKKELGLAGLLDSTWRGRPKARLTPKMKNYVIGLKRERIHRRPARIYEYLIHKFSPQAAPQDESKGSSSAPPHPLPSEATVRRFIQKWERENHELVAFLKNPDKWRSDYQAALGDGSVKALHFLHMIEFDNTPADVMCADGRRYTLTGAIDIFSRKARCLVVPTSKSVAVAGLMRWIILEWGLFDVMIADNGKDYASRHIEAACGALGIELQATPPFTPEAKPHIEAFFHTISTMLFEELQGYIGHSVADRKALESQRSFAQRMFRKDEVIECRMTAAELQGVIDTWTEKVYHQRKHSGLGTSPEAKAGQSVRTVKRILNERVLDILLAPVGKATVGKKGIRYQNGRFVAPELADHIKECVQVRRDLADAGTVYVFDAESRFICTARDAALEGLTVEEAVVARKRQQKKVREQARALTTLAQEVGDPMSELLEAKREERGQVVAFRREEEARSAAIDEAQKAVEFPEGGEGTFEPVELAGDDEHAGDQKVVPLREEPIFTGYAAKLERYRWLEEQKKMRTLTEREVGFMEGYEGSEEYFRIFVEPYQ